MTSPELRDINDIIEYLSRLRAATDNIIATMRPSAFPGAINWGDLGCKAALLGIDDDGRMCLRVVVEEVSPDEADFCRYIAQQLAAHDWPAVDVMTEW